jgi:signal transduction histidine kinase
VKKKGRLRKAREEIEKRGARLTEVRRAHQRLQLLYDISKLLTRFESVEHTVPKVMTIIAQALPTRSAVLVLEMAGEPRLIASQAEGESAERLQAAKAHAQSAYSYLVRSGVDREGARAQTLERPGRPAGNRPPGQTKNVIVLPIVVNHDAVFGALQIEGAARFDELDLVFVNAVVNHLAIALDRLAAVKARQAEAESARAASEKTAAEAKRSEQTQRFLSETSAVLFSTLEYGKTLEAVLRAAVPLLADMCYVDEVAEDGRIQRLAVADPTNQHLADQIRKLPPRPEWPPSQVLRSGTSILLEKVTSFETIAQDQVHAAFLKAAGVQSMMCVPLVARGRTLGALTFVAAESAGRYSARDLELAEEVGRRAALAIDNARLYEQAQRAIQARQDLLAIVSHDLRNPLGTILMNTAMLLNASSPGESEAPGRRPIEAMQRAADRMNRIIADLLDLASIEAGRLTVEKKEHAVSSLVQEVFELHEPIAAQKKLRLERELLSEPFDIHCDRERVLQIFGNLIGNAIKFTPEGGTIKVRAEQRGEGALFSVADTGSGLSPDELPHVFDRYWQAKKTARLGTGLGLSITRGLLEAHGGRIWAESRLGEGTTFFFTIPLGGADQSRPGQTDTKTNGVVR